MTLPATPASASAARPLRTSLGRVFLAAVGLTLLAYGSASSVQSSFAAIAFALLALISTTQPIGSSQVRYVHAAAILLLAVLVGYAAIQALPVASPDLANSAWKSLVGAIGPAPAAISVAPGMTLDALASLALPFLAFVGALVFFQSDDEAIWLWRALAAFGAACAIFGVLQELLAPDQILFEPKRFYLGSLTASFINRNTAGTFFGLALLLNIGLTFHELRGIRIARFVKKSLNLDIGWPDKNARVIVQALCCAICAVALFLTQSRGATAATFVASYVALAAMTARPVTADKPDERFAKWRRWAALIGSLLALVSLFALFAGRSVQRFEEAGAEDTRWCAFGSLLHAIHDNWALGAGFGAFQDVFPLYRDSGCAGIFGVWERAHNVFLEGWIGLGLIFPVALAIGYAILLGVLLRGARRRRRLRFAPVIGLSALVLVSLHAMVDFSLQIPGFAVYFAVVLAAATTVSLGRARQ
jgi:hypothetical protein